MLTRKQALDLADKYGLIDSPEGKYSHFDECVINALIEASRGDFHLKIAEARKNSGLNNSSI